MNKAEPTKFITLGEGDSRKVVPIIDGKIGGGAPPPLEVMRKIAAGTRDPRKKAAWEKRIKGGTKMRETDTRSQKKAERKSLGSTYAEIIEGWQAKAEDDLRYGSDVIGDTLGSGRFYWKDGVLYRDEYSKERKGRRGVPLVVKATSADKAAVRKAIETGTLEIYRRGLGMGQRPGQDDMYYEKLHQATGFPIDPKLRAQRKAEDDAVMAYLDQHPDATSQEAFASVRNKQLDLGDTRGMSVQDLRDAGMEGLQNVKLRYAEVYSPDVVESKARDILMQKVLPALVGIEDAKQRWVVSRAAQDAGKRIEGRKRTKGWLERSYLNEWPLLNRTERERQEKFQAYRRVLEGRLASRTKVVGDVRKVTKKHGESSDEDRLARKASAKKQVEKAEVSRKTPMSRVQRLDAASKERWADLQHISGFTPDHTAVHGGVKPPMTLSANKKWWSDGNEIRHISKVGYPTTRGKKKSRRMSDDDVQKYIDSKIADQEPAHVVGVRKGKTGDMAYLRVGRGMVRADAHRLAELMQDAGPTVRVKAANPYEPVTVWQGKDLVGAVMPLRPSEGDTVNLPDVKVPDYFRDAFQAMGADTLPHNASPDRRAFVDAVKEGIWTPGAVRYALKDTGGLALLRENLESGDSPLLSESENPERDRKKYLRQLSALRSKLEGLGVA